MKPNIFVIEDTKELADLILMYLKKNEMDGKAFSNAEDAIKQLNASQKLPSLIVLDLNLPGMSGFEFLEIFRKEYKPSIPVIIISARDTDEDILKGLGIGAEEFVTKPFSPRILIARINALLHYQAVTIAQAEDTIQFGEYTLLLNSCTLKKDSIKIPLSEKEYAVLEFLAKNPGKTLSPETIYSSVWKAQYGDITAVAV
ncbi:MAG: response regulator transcription factor, partial [Treponema sp.]|nr:response regulator transcription factor [Treponema sp.]